MCKDNEILEAGYLSKEHIGVIHIFSQATQDDKSVCYSRVVEGIKYSVEVEATEEVFIDLIRLSNTVYIELVKQYLIRENKEDFLKLP